MQNCMTVGIIYSSEEKADMLDVFFHFLPSPSSSSKTQQVFHFLLNAEVAL